MFSAEFMEWVLPGTQFGTQSYFVLEGVGTIALIPSRLTGEFLWSSKYGEAN